MEEHCVDCGHGSHYHRYKGFDGHCGYGGCDCKLMVYPKTTDDNTLSSDLAAAGIDRDRLRAWLAAQSSADCRALLERLDKGEFDGQVAIGQPAPALRDVNWRNLAIAYHDKTGEGHPLPHSFNSIPHRQQVEMIQAIQYVCELYAKWYALTPAAQVARGTVAQGGIDREKLIERLKMYAGSAKMQMVEPGAKTVAVREARGAQAALEEILGDIQRGDFDSTPTTDALAAQRPLAVEVERVKTAFANWRDAGSNITLYPIGARYPDYEKSVDELTEAIAALPSRTDDGAGRDTPITFTIDELRIISNAMNRRLYVNDRSANVALQNKIDAAMASPEPEATI